MVCVNRQRFKRGGLLYRVLPLALLGLFLSVVAVGETGTDIDIESPTEDKPEPPGENCQRTDYEKLDLTQRVDSQRVIASLQESEGKAIRHIRIISGDIFDESDPEEDRWLYRGFNRLHINTREPVIKAQLLFAEEDPLRWRIVRESARILRSRSYLSSAYIVPEVICDDHIDLLVMTRDAWVTEPEVYFGYEGGNTRSGFGIKDGNFLGTGDNVSIGYTQDELRRSVSYDYRSPHLFGTRMTGRLFYAEKSDGNDKVVRLEQPFYSLDSPWAAGIVSENLSEVSVVRDRGEDINEYRHKITLHEAYFGVSLASTDELTRRIIVGYSEEADEYFELETTERSVPDDRAANYPWVAYQFIENEYATYKNLNQIQRTEDIALGMNLYLRAGYGGRNLDNVRDVIRFKGDLSKVLGVGEHHLLQLQTALDGRYYPNFDGNDSSVLDTQVAYNYFIDTNHRWYARVSYTVGYDLAQHEELTVGGMAGLRGYPTDFQRGYQRYLVTLERRYYSEIHFMNIVRVGAVAFVDLGRAWGGEGNRDNTHLSNVGVGLRFSSSKARVGNLLHVDIAAPTGAKQGVKTFQWLIKGETVF